MKIEIDSEKFNKYFTKLEELIKNDFAHQIMDIREMICDLLKLKIEEACPKPGDQWEMRNGDIVYIVGRIPLSLCFPIQDNKQQIIAYLPYNGRITHHSLDGKYKFDSAPARYDLIKKVS